MKVNASRYLRVAWILCGIFLLVALCSCAPIYTYSSSDIHIKFVDNNTGQPLESVMVLASWSTFTAGVEWIPNISGHGGPQPSCVKLANVEAALSGVDGIAVLPRWTVRGACMTMPASQPRIVIYKPGYEMLDLYNNNNRNDNATISMRSQSSWDGKTIALNEVGHGKAKDGEDEQVDNLAVYISAVFNAATSQVHPTKCYWAEARPAFVMAMRDERRLDSYFHDSPSPSFHRGFRLMEQVIDQAYAPNFYEIGDWTCGETKTYLKGLLMEVDGTIPKHGPLW